MAAAYVLIDFDISIDFPDTLNAIRQVSGVQTAHLVVGPTDCIAYVEATDHQKLLQVIQSVRAVRGVDRTDTRTVADL